MSTEDIEALAAEYVLETMAEEQRLEFEHKLMADPELRHTVERWEDRLGLLAEDGPAIEPSAQLWAAIEAETAQLPLPGLITIRQADITWEKIGHGLRKKVLYINHDEGYQSFLLRFDPGARLRTHQHRLTEECLVLEGEMTVGNKRLYPGDFHVAEVGSTHREIGSDTGGLVFIRAQLDEMAARPQT